MAETLTVVLPSDIAAKVDLLIKREKPPAWPFASRTVIRVSLRPPDRRKLDEYLKDYAAYETRIRDGSSLRSRSAVIRKIIIDHFAALDGNNLQKQEPPNVPPVIGKRVNRLSTKLMSRS